MTSALEMRSRPGSGHTAEAVIDRFGQVTLLRSDRNLGAVGRNLAACRG